jgi:hypothetical protein
MLSPPPTPCHLQRIRKPLQHIRDIMSGEGAATPSTPESHTDAHDPEMPGLTPCNEEEDDDDSIGGVWFILDGETVLLEDFEGFEEALLAKTLDTEVLEPQMLTEAKRWLDWPLWEKAIQEELATLKKAGTWKLEAPPPEANVIGSKWVFNAKKDAVGNIVRYKARPVA